MLSNDMTGYSGEYTIVSVISTTVVSAAFFALIFHYFIFLPYYALFIDS
jgi:riboflavin transporter FmnP